MSLKQWQCPHCGQWVDDGWWRHSHIVQREPSLEEMIHARERGEGLGVTDDAVTYMRTGKEQMRETPL